MRKIPTTSFTAHAAGRRKQHAVIGLTLLTTFLVIVLSATRPEAAHACSCLAISVDTAYSHADAVFLGTVVRVERLLSTYRISDSLTYHHPYIVAHVRVGRVWKGAPDSLVAIRTGSGGGDCGIPFAADSSYLIYARSFEHKYTAGICSRTGPAWYRADDIRKLDARYAKKE